MYTETPTTAYNKEAYRALASCAVDAVEEHIINEIIAGDRAFSLNTIADSKRVSKARYMMGLRIFFSNIYINYGREIIAESCENPNDYLEYPWNHIADYLAKELSDTMQAFIAQEVESRGDV